MLFSENCKYELLINGLIDFLLNGEGEFCMGTIIGLAVLATIDWYLFRKTGLHIHQLIAKKYAEYLDGKENRK